MKTKNPWSRRRFLASVGLGGASLLLPWRMPRLAHAAESQSFADGEHPFLIFCLFDGGWDQLLALDPRDETAYGESAFIQPQYNYLAPGDGELAAVLAATNGSGVVAPAGSNISFGPAVGRLSDAYADLAVFRGVDMGTLTHEVGRRYFITGEFPNGRQAKGSALPSYFVSETGDRTALPNVAVGVESFAEDLEPYATALSVRSSLDLLTVLAALGPPVGTNTTAALDAYAYQHKCAEQWLADEGSLGDYLAARDRALVLGSGELAQHFQFNTNPSPALQPLYEAFGVSGGAGAINQQLQGAAGQAMIAAQAITNGVAQGVSISLTRGIDHHDGDYATDHAPALRSGFNALADLINYLKATPDDNGKPYWDRTLIVACSEFARTPRINGRGGRDHHLASSCLLAGMGIRGNTLVGATSDVNFDSESIDPVSGELDPGGHRMRPTDIHATALAAMGLSTDNLSSAEPVVIEAALK